VVLLPWTATRESFFAFDWIADLGTTNGSAIAQAVHGKIWLIPLILPLLAILKDSVRKTSAQRPSSWLLYGSLGVLAWLALIAFSINLRGWTWSIPAELFGDLPSRNPGLGAGAWMLGLAATMLFCCGLARRGAFAGDTHPACAVGLVSSILALFVAYPLVRIGISAFETPKKVLAPALFLERLLKPEIWTPGGVVMSTMLLGICSGAASTLLAACFAILTERTRAPGLRALRGVSILPIITPPFVIGLAIILLFGRNGALSHALETLFGITPTRWIYGFQGVLFAQVLSFTPIAYLVIVGVVRGLNPALEEAAQTLHTKPLRLFFTVTLPLAMPGLTNAFLVCFIESLGDFGNPLLLGGNLNVLSTSIYFDVVGARADQGAAAVLSLILLLSVMILFLLQRRLMAGKAYTTISGKGQSGRAAELPSGVVVVAIMIALPWAALTLILYGTVMVGGFVENLGLSDAFTLQHYKDAFEVTFPDGLPQFTGQAWDSLFTTLILAAIASPLTAVVGLISAHTLRRYRFRGRDLFELGTLMAAAVPGTVLGIGYILAFNNPPLELVGTSAIVILSFVVRNMGVGVRAGIAGLAQLDPSLEEASAMLRASSFRTLRMVVAPLLRPAIIAALVYGFVSAMTSVSAVIFLVSPGVMLSTVYIVNVAEAGTYGIALAAASILILVMLLVIFGISRLVGQPVMRRPAPTVSVIP
jgi:iron(III) transport system permease protein